MQEVKSGILAGVKIEEEKAEIMAKVADKIRELDNGVLDPEEAVLGDIMGAGSTVDEEIERGAVVVGGDGSQVADHGLLTGVEISDSNAEVLNKVADSIKEIEAFEADGTKKRSDIDELSDTLAVTMGVKGE